ncbi:MAG: FAD-binding oxidoreductase [Actinomycetota bacterium]
MTMPRTAQHELADRVEGAVIGPDDPRYDEARSAWNLAYTHRPTVVVDAGSVADVVETVHYAAAHGLTLAVQATGHGVTLPADDAVLLLTRRLDHVQVHPSTGTATVGGGATWVPVLAAAQREGLAPLVGSSPGVGAVGYTLGGGFGWLARRYGLSADRVRSITIVLADGWVVQASPTSHPDLFWALRGGGAGSLGVVVEMEIDLVPVAEVYGGNLLYPVGTAAEVFEFYREWSRDLPDEMTSAFNITAFPTFEMVPEPLRGRTFAIVRGCHCGDPVDGAALVDRWRAWRTPEMDMFGPMPFAEVAAISQDPVDPVPATTSGRWLTGLSDDLPDAMLDSITGGDGSSPVLFAEVRHAGGAINRTDARTSYFTRDAVCSIEIAAITPGPDAMADARRRVGSLFGRLDGLIHPQGVYLNFTEGAERVFEARNAFDDVTWAKLAAVKADVDPANMFAHGIDLRG